MVSDRLKWIATDIAVAKALLVATLSCVIDSAASVPEVLFPVAAPPPNNLMSVCNHILDTVASLYFRLYFMTECIYVSRSALASSFSHLRGR